MTSEHKTCAAVNANGKPCRAMPGVSGFCYTHDPALADARASSRRRGGLARASALARAVLPAADVSKALRTPAAVRDLLAVTIRNAQTGRLDSRIAAVVGGLAATLLKAMEQADVERRLAELESRMTERQNA